MKDFFYVYLSGIGVEEILIPALTDFVSTLSHPEIREIYNPRHCVEQLI
ncbi:uncharacterized protein METZ01_LOCUS143502 [marine metagenome]|uniref:Uncharacterized protein n=1 Tax=marine metagenome TaxID=408172 RepID=A0A381ZMU4_9ZZZZ